MAYVDQNQSKEKTIAFVITLIIMVGVAYALITGLAYNVIKKAAQDMKVIDVQDQPPPPPPPPPPPKEQPKPEVPPPPSTPPPLVRSPAPPPPITTVTTLNPPPPPPPRPVAVAPPAPPAPPAVAVAGHPKGSLASLMSNDDYPPAAIRSEEQGTTGFSLTYDASGRVNNCSVTSSSGHSDLDDTACKLLTRRARFVPGKDTAGNSVGGTYASRFTWVLPKD